MNAQNLDGDTPLYLAISYSEFILGSLYFFFLYFFIKQSDRMEAADLLLKAGALKDIKNRYGDTSLEIAKSKGEIHVQQQIILCMN